MKRTRETQMVGLTAMSSGTSVRWFLLVLSVSAACGQQCSQSVENLLSLVGGQSLVQSFPRDYQVWIHVTAANLNAKACAYTALGLLTGDWSNLRSNLWQGKELYKKVCWILKGLSELNVTKKTEGCAWEVPVSQLINSTLRALGNLRDTQCAPCPPAGSGPHPRGPDTEGSGEPDTAPCALPPAADQPTEEADEEEVEQKTEGEVADATRSPRPGRNSPAPSAVPGGGQEEGEGGKRSPGPVSRGDGLPWLLGSVSQGDGLPRDDGLPWLLGSVSRGDGLPRWVGWLPFRLGTPRCSLPGPGAGRRGSRDRPMGRRGLRGPCRRLRSPGPGRPSGRGQGRGGSSVPAPGQGARGGGVPAGLQLSEL